jgi:hypothetical protein
VTAEETRPATPDHRDRSTRLFVVGIFLIVLGCCSILLGAFSAVTLLILPETPEAPQYGVAQMVQGLLVYVGLGAFLIALGVGSIRARRWVRPLVLILGWSWLAMGVLGGLMSAFMMPWMLDAFAAEDPALPWVMVGCFGTMFGLFGVLAPVALILLYRGRDVAATLDARDPREVCTDKIPTPLLGLVLWLAYGALAMVASSLYAVFPMGETILTGAPAVAVSLAFAALWGYLAVQLARRDRTAWWVAVVAVVAMVAWALTVFPRTDWNELLRLMGTPVDQPGMPDFAAMYQSPWFLAWMGVIWAGMLAYLLFVRRYLR